MTEITADPFKGALVIVFAAVFIACAICAVRRFREKRRSAWNKRFADIRFTPRQDEVKKHYAEYEKPSYLRTSREYGETSAFLRRQAE